MAKSAVPHFQNDAGVPQIKIGVKKFMCVGASSPHDHPHIYLDMGEESDKVCPYCSTLFIHDAQLAQSGSKPAGCLIELETA